MLNAAFEGEKRGRAVGIWAAAGAAAAAIAPLIGGWLVSHVGWPAIFYINLPLALGAILLALKFVSESQEKGAGRTDYAGALLITAGLGGLTYALTLWSASGGWSTAAIATGIAGVVLMRSLPVVERQRGQRAMMPIGLFGDRCFCGPQPAYLPSLRRVQRSDAAHPLRADHQWRLFAGAGRPGDAPATGPDDSRLAHDGQSSGADWDRGSRSPSGRWSSLLAWCSSRMIQPDSSYWIGAFPAMLVIALGMTIAVAPLTSSVLGSVEEQHVAMASGFNSAVARLGGLIATALLGSVLGKEGTALFAGFHAAMFLSAAVAALASVVALTMLRHVKMKKS